MSKLFITQFPKMLVFGVVGIVLTVSLRSRGLGVRASPGGPLKAGALLFMGLSKNHLMRSIVVILVFFQSDSGQVQFSSY